MSTDYHILAYTMSSLSINILSNSNNKLNYQIKICNFIYEGHRDDEIGIHEVSLMKKSKMIF